jgi:four helix bundle protein
MCELTVRVRVTVTVRLAHSAIRFSIAFMHRRAMALKHQRLIVYQKALDVLVSVLHITRGAKPGWSDLCNQMKRAATSIALNIAEGSAEYSPAEKARLYRIALRSCAECHAACDVMVKVEVTSSDMIAAPQAAMEEIVAMLTAMCKKVESRA